MESSINRRLLLLSSKLEEYFIARPCCYSIGKPEANSSTIADPLSVILKQRKALTNSKEEMLTALLEQREDIFEKNLQSILKDEMRCRTEIRQFKDLGDRETARKLRLTTLPRIEKERRDEAKTLFKDNFQIKKMLMEVAVERLTNEQRGELFESLE